MILLQCTNYRGETSEQILKRIIIELEELTTAFDSVKNHAGNSASSSINSTAATFGEEDASEGAHKKWIPEEDRKLQSERLMKLDAAIECLAILTEYLQISPSSMSMSSFGNHSRSSTDGSSDNLVDQPRTASGSKGKSSKDNDIPAACSWSPQNENYYKRSDSMDSTTSSNPFDLHVI